MNSLSAHLTAGPHHGRLRFHPDCPLCRRERLAGDALPDALLPARAQAGLLAAALGAGTLLPAGASAASPAAGKPAPAEVSQRPAPRPAPAPDRMQPGADETQEAPRDEAPQLRELLSGPEVGSDTQGEDVDVEDEGTEPAPPAPLGQPPVEALPMEQSPVTPVEPAPAPAPWPSPAPAEPPAAPPSAELEQPTTDEKPSTPTKRRGPKRVGEVRQRARRLVTNPAPAPAAPPPVALEAAAPTIPAATVPVSQQAEPAEGPVSGASYTVRRGDSLWSIARRLLGGSPSAGQVAREVDRLWRLNAERVGTGNPSLIYPGTVLRLR